MRSIGFLLLLAFGAAPELLADPCSIDSLSNYIALGSTGCQVGGLTVKDFSYSAISTTVTIAAGSITVTPFFGGYTVALTFSSSAFDVSGSDHAEYLLAYTWDPGDIRSLEDILNTSTPVFPGLAKITTDACEDAAFSGSICGTTTATVVVSHDGITPHLTDTVFFSPPVGILGIRNDILLEANGASSEFSSFSNQLTLPEPSSLVEGLTALALICLGIRLKRL